MPCKENIKHTLDPCVYEYINAAERETNHQYTFRPHLHLGLIQSNGFTVHSHKYIYKNQQHTVHSRRVMSPCPCCKCIYLCKTHDTSHDAYKACCPSGVFLHKRGRDHILLFLHQQTKTGKISLNSGCRQ